jgi:hypothetical protein
VSIAINECRTTLLNFVVKLRSRWDILLPPGFPSLHPRRAHRATQPLVCPRSLRTRT